MMSKEDIKKYFEDLLPWEKEELSRELYEKYCGDDRVQPMSISDALCEYNQEEILDTIGEEAISEFLCDYGGWDMLLDCLETEKFSVAANYIFNRCKKICGSICDLIAKYFKEKH